MENPDKSFSSIVKTVKHWIRRCSEPTDISRDFWMPDHSCRVCYDCDSQFTVFNRRHHCRRCGRIFCGKCTANFIPVYGNELTTSYEEVDRIRVCNFCFKQWEHEMGASARGIRASLSPSLSSISLCSSKPSETPNSISTPGDSYSNGVYQHVAHGSGVSPRQSSQLKPFSDEQDVAVLGKNAASIADKDVSSQIQFCYYTNRSDDEDDYGAFDSDIQAQHQQHSTDGFYGPVEFDERERYYDSKALHTVDVDVNSEDICSPMDNRDFHDSLANEKCEDEEEHRDGYYCNPSSSIYALESNDTEPVDFENNGLLWLPPDPEDEEDERETIPFDDEDDSMAECGHLQPSNSFGSDEYENRDRSNEEHKRAMKSVVDCHFKALMAQLLQVENISIGEEDDKSWLEIVSTLSWEAANFLKPDMSKGGGMDPGGYVKVKCLACGHRNESMVVKGVICKKNMAHRRMATRIDKPRFLILGGALEYQRVTNLLSSIDTLLQQEIDYLKMAVAKIVAQQPNILLVEKTVARYAQDLLLEKDISLVLNIKRPLLERIARCTGAQIVPSTDHLSSQKLGHCELFHVEKFFEHHDSSGQGMKKIMKTLMFFEGCPKPLGCTVLLKGDNIDELKRVKHVIQYGIFAAYHLALETSFLADEGASLPELPLKPQITVALPDKPTSINSSISTVPPPSTPRVRQEAGIQNHKIATSNHLNRPPSIDANGIYAESSESEVCSNSSNGYGTIKEKNKVNFGDRREFVWSRSNGHANDTDSEISGALANGSQVNSNIVNEEHSESMASNQELDRRNQNTPLREELLPASDHQSILVSLSTRCVWKGTVCERAQLFRIKYYGNFDKPLGRFLQGDLFDQSYHCRSCDMPSEAHVHCYTHRQGSLTISVRKLPEFRLPGEHDGKIWMWHRCLWCPRSNGFPPATRRVVMSDAAWGLSFGKFLELSFSDHAAASRVASCGHSLRRDCLRFYGFGKMVACFRYAPIDVHSVCLPPHKLDFECEPQEWQQQEANEVAEKVDSVFNGILNALHKVADKGTTSSMEAPEPRHYTVELEAILQKERAEFEDSFYKILKKEVRKGQIIDILEINKLRRQLLFHSYLWDQRLLFAARSDIIGQEVLNTLVQQHKEKLASNDSYSDSNAITKLQNRFSTSDTTPEDVKISEQLKENSNLNQQKIYIEPECKTSLYTSISVSEQSIPLELGLVGRRTLSDGHFPIISDLSNAFDAKWTGEKAQVHSKEGISDPSASIDSAAVLALSEDPQEQSGTEIAPSFAAVLLNKLGDSAEDLSSWIGLPFLHFYRLLNKNWGDYHRFDALNEYAPVSATSFREFELQGGPRFLLPLGVNEIVIGIYDDEPTSIISYALVSHEYHIQISDERERTRDGMDTSMSAPSSVARSFSLSQSVDEIAFDPSNFGSLEESALSKSGSRGSLASEPFISTKTMHVRVSFADEGPLGKLKYTVTCYYANQFDALRRICCPSEVDYIRSLSRCKKWGAQGGKSNVFFAKSLDDRFIIKQVTKTELESFIKFAPEYFKYLSESIGTGSPTCLAKILGIYQVISKNLKSGKELKIDVLVMENLLFGRQLTRLYDLKGSARSRYNADTSGSNKVLLDQNLMEAMLTNPIFVGNKAKRLLERAVWNDTSFLASVDVMDYSLLVGVDEKKHELVLGIIDFMRQYTWDKHLETWVKASGILGGPKNVSPTVISPKQYKKRFRKAMSAYFLVVPDQWSPPANIASMAGTESCEDSQPGDSIRS